ncbi:phosphotransferase [Labrys neptuniae]
MQALGDPQAPRFTQAEAEQLAARRFGLDCAACGMTSERDQNFRLSTQDGRQFILKIANAGEDLAALESQNQVLSFLAAVAGDVPAPRLLAAFDGQAMFFAQGTAGRHAVRLFTCLPGEVASARLRSQAFRHAVGAMAARLDLALAGFDWTAPDRGLIWDLKHAGKVRELISYETSSQHRQLLYKAFDLFQSIALPRLADLPAQPIHNDFNAGNLLVEPTRPDQVSGIIDFGDMVCSPRIIEVAVAAAHQMSEQPDPMAAAADVVAGYHETAKLGDGEFELLPVLILTRLAMRMTIIARRKVTHPGSAHFDPKVDESLWAAIAIIAEGDRASLSAGFAAACHS